MNVLVPPAWSLSGLSRAYSREELIQRSQSMFYNEISNNIQGCRVNEGQNLN